jgi:hypothetical protein
MSEREDGPYGSIARKWLALAERRRAHLIDILESGRWRNHASDGKLEDQLYELDLLCSRFAAIAGMSSAAMPAIEAISGASEPSPWSLPLGNAREPNDAAAGWTYRG